MLEPAPIVELENDPTPKGLQMFWFRADDGLRLRAAICPAIGQAKGSILFAPGRTEYIEKYFEFIREMTAKGLTVAVIDHRGQGLSERLLANSLLGHVDDFANYSRDLETLWAIIEDKMPGPRFLMAHSMGGAIATDLVRRGNIRFDKLAASAPMMGFAGVSGFQKNLIAILSALSLKKLQPPGVSGGGALDPEAAKVLTSDTMRFDRDIRRNTIEPKLQLGGPTVGWLSAAIRLHKSFEKPGGLHGVELPVYFASASLEALVSNLAIEQSCKNIPQAKCEEIKGSLHEILQECDAIRDRFMDRLFKFTGV